MRENGQHIRSAQLYQLTLLPILYIKLLKYYNVFVLNARNV